VDLNDENYTQIKNYVKTYKDSYSKEQIYNTLKDNNFSEELIEKVFENEY